MFTGTFFPRKVQQGPPAIIMENRQLVTDEPFEFAT